MTNRWDETWHRLLEWTNGQTPSERLAAQILADAGYTSIDPSHPLGGPDGTHDARCLKNGRPWIMAVYFPRGQHSFTDIKKKLRDDLVGVTAHAASGIAFVTNQELRLGEREELSGLADPHGLDLFHLERVTTVLDKPSMASVRKQFLGIDFNDESVRDELQTMRTEMARMQQHMEALQTGGETFCYWMLYHFDIERSIAQQSAVIRKGEYALHDVRVRIRDMDTEKEVNRRFGEINSPAIFELVQWRLRPVMYYRAFFHARNGSWNQDLQLTLDQEKKYWRAATRVKASNGEIRHEESDSASTGSEVVWRR